jgi:hypothetical protein
MSSFIDAFRVERETVWHWINFVEGKIIFKPNFLGGKMHMAKGCRYGSSSHFRIYLVATLSKVSKIQVLDIPAIVKFHEILESK